ncbi:MAG TPA: cobyrinate a,c-diamide synthase [Geobacteraceae bacterium]
MKAFVIAAPHSGAGKTTVTLAIMAALAARGMRVAPFKVGPDFIDPGYHRLVTGSASVNLDGWICPEHYVAATFARHVEDADVAVVEGVMGLFDGIGATSDVGSTAQVAALLRLPVVLVVDAKGQARSVAALVQGFARFDPRVEVTGVILNNVASERHGALLREAMAAGCPEVRVLGAIPRDAGLHIPSRHLGLVTAEDNPLSAGFVGHLVAVAERHLDLEGLLAFGGAPHPRPLSHGERVASPSPFGGETERGIGRATSSVRIAVARDAAFCFVYDDNLRLLREVGAELVEFSPLADEGLPAETAGIYLPGGYPELFAEALAANGAMREAIRQAVEAGMPVYAECGGFIYLTGGVVSVAGAQHAAPLQEFVGIFPVTTRMLPRRKALGYREVEFTADTVLGRAGTVARGHEFHYSETAEMPAAVERLYRVRRADADLGPEGYRYRNCLASYVHLHFGSNPGLAPAFVTSCRRFSGTQADCV